MTWGEFKKKIEKAGIKDSDELHLINMGASVIPIFPLGGLHEENPFEHFGEESP